MSLSELIEVILKLAEDTVSATSEYVVVKGELYVYIIRGTCWQGPKGCRILNCFQGSLISYGDARRSFQAQIREFPLLMNFEHNHNTLRLISLWRKPGSLDAALQISHIWPKINVG
jgi:hypothetical protein